MVTQNNEWQDLVTDVDGFWNEESKSPVTGRVMSIVTMDLGLGETLVAIIQLTAECKAVKGSGDDKEEITLATGQAIGVVIKHKLSELESFVENNNEIRIEAVKKVALPKGKRTMWIYKVQFKGRRTLRPVTRTRSGGGSGDPEKDAEESLSNYS